MKGKRAMTNIIRHKGSEIREKGEGGKGRERGEERERRENSKTKPRNRGIISLFLWRTATLNPGDTQELK